MRTAGPIAGAGDCGVFSEDVFVGLGELGFVEHGGDIGLEDVEILHLDGRTAYSFVLKRQLDAGLFGREAPLLEMGDHFLVGLGLNWLAESFKRGLAGSLPCDKTDA